MKRLAIIFIIVFVLPGLAWAADTSFRDLDKNGDGKLTREELDQKALQVFKENDENGDGTLSKSEFDRIKGAQTKFEDLDTNKDGKLTIQELRKAAKERFDQLDRSHSNLLTEEDLKCSPRYKPEASPLFSVYF